MSGLTPLESRVAEAVDASALVEAARRLVRIPSWNGNETPAQELMIELMGAVGLEVDPWTIPMDEVASRAGS